MDNIIETARQYAQMDKERRRLEGELEELKEQMAVIEPILLEAFSSQQVEGPIRLRDVGLSVYVRSDMRARIIPGEEAKAFAAFRRHGLGSMVKEIIWPNTLSAYAREQERLGEEIPEEIRTSIDAQRIYSIRTRASS